LKELDAKALETLSQKVNVIPLIAKADTMTTDEKKSFKSILLNNLQDYNIRTFPSSYPEDVDGAEELLQHVPFTVIGSDTVADIGGRMARCRTYRWGVVEVENAEHSDFIYLRELLMSTCLHDLVETTHNVHYHKHRSSHLRAIGRPRSILECDDTYESQVEGAKQTNKADMDQKEEAIRQSFVQRVKEKEVNLREREEKMAAKKVEMEAELEMLRAKLEAGQKELDDAVVTLQRSGTLSKNSSKLFKAK
ncbi:Septin-6, partial [Lunasporangiospora selenospora]